MCALITITKSSPMTMILSLKLTVRILNFLVFDNLEFFLLAGSSSMASADTISLGKTKDANKLESIKNWTISTYKCSRQALFEKLGKTSRTVDTELETQIENLRDTQRKYGHILKLARALTSHFYHVIQTQVKSFRYFLKNSNSHWKVIFITECTWRMFQ